MSLLNSFKNIVRRRALEHGKSVFLWRKLCKPSAFEWAEYLRRHGGFRSFGKDCFVLLGSVFTDKHMTSIGNNVWISEAWISCHDGSAIMMARAYGEDFDAVAPVTIGNDVFIGKGAIILPGVTIGSKVVIGAGSVVSRDIPDNSLAAGVPARVIRTLDEHAGIIKARTHAYPWFPLIQARGKTHNPDEIRAIEADLRRQRDAFFYPPESPPALVRRAR